MFFTFNIIYIFVKNFNFNIFMTDLFENKLGMIMRLQLFYNTYAADLVAVPIISTFNIELTNNLNNLITLASNTSQDLTGYALDKQDKKDNLILAILKISTAYTMWAQLNGQITDVERFGISIPALKAKRANDLFTFAQNLHTTAQPKLALLAPFGVVVANFTNLTATAALFLEAIDAPIIQITERAAKNKALHLLMKSTIDELLLKLDYAMKILETSNQSLYNRYKMARKVEKVAVRKKPTYNMDIAANTTLLVDELPYKASRIFNLKNTGNAILILSLSTMPNQVEGRSMAISPGKSTSRLSTTLNTDAESIYLVVYNPDPLVAGSFKILVE